MTEQTIIEKTAEHVLKTMKKKHHDLNQRDVLLQVCCMVIDVIEKNTGSYSIEKKRSMCVKAFDDICRDLDLLHSVTYKDGVAIIMDWFDQYHCGCKWRSCW